MNRLMKSMYRTTVLLRCSVALIMFMSTVFVLSANDVQNQNKNISTPFHNNLKEGWVISSVKLWKFFPWDSDNPWHLVGDIPYGLSGSIVSGSSLPLDASSDWKILMDITDANGTEYSICVLPNISKLFCNETTEGSQPSPVVQVYSPFLSNGGVWVRNCYTLDEMKDKGPVAVQLEFHKPKFSEDDGRSYFSEVLTRVSSE